MKIHFIGICGVAMGGLAIAFKQAGWQVSGSDAGFFPPVSTNLQKHKTNFYPGWHPELMIKNGEPDLIVVGNVAGSENPEWLYVQKHKLPYLSYPELIEKYFVKKNSIVCAGTYGKTTTAALLSWILTEAGYKPSYMFGGLAVDENFYSASLGNNEPRKLQTSPKSHGNYSIIEGDEYKSSRWDESAKFFHYHPTHLLLTDVKWDHADVYPTEKSYFEAFEKLIRSVPERGIIVMNEKIKDSRLKIQNFISFGKSKDNHYIFSNVEQNSTGLKFKITHQSSIFSLQSSLLGDYMTNNITGVFAMAREIGIEPEKIIDAIARFKGLKKRLEKRYEGKATVFDDIAHSPAKAKAALESLRKLYNGKIFCVFEPNTGNRQPQSAPSYNNAFIDADEVIIPRLTKLKTAGNLRHFEGEELAEVIRQTHNNVKYIDDDEKLINRLAVNSRTGKVVIFCGSHGFRGMIDELTNRLMQTYAD